MDTDDEEEEKTKKQKQSNSAFKKTSQRRPNTLGSEYKSKKAVSKFLKIC